jgi:hypothetical protein
MTPNVLAEIYELSLLNMLNLLKLPVTEPQFSVTRQYILNSLHYVINLKAGIQMEQ